MNNLTRYKDIILYRTLAGLKSEARKNYLGSIWFLLEPLLSTAIFYFAMSHLNGQRGAAAILSILLGMIAWQWFEGAVLQSSGSILGKYHVHLQVPLPKYLFPLVDIGVTTIRFSFAFSIVFISCLWLGPSPTWSLLWLPIILLMQLAYIVALSLVCSIGLTLLPDLRLLVQSAFRLLFFLSGIFFTAKNVPPSLLPWFHANPMSVFIESYRAILLNRSAPDLGLLISTLPAIAALAVLGVWINVRYDKRLLKLINA